jgi:hypothetical protein
VSSSVSTVASWILIIVFLSYVCVCVAVVYLFSFKRGCLLVPLQVTMINRSASIA